MHTKMVQREQWWDRRAVPSIGVGCYEAGLRQSRGDRLLERSFASRSEAISGLEAAYEMGVRLYDSAIYRCRHSEELLGQVFAKKDDVVIVTKIGQPDHIRRRPVLPAEFSVASIEASVELSRTRLKKDKLDLVLLNVSDLPTAEAKAIFDTLELLITKRKVSAFGWSTNLVDRVSTARNTPGFVAVECEIGVFANDREIVPFAAASGLVALARTDDLEWLRMFKKRASDSVHGLQLETVRELLMSGGRTLAQGALAWTMAQGHHVCPTIGIRHEAQVREALGAVELGPLLAGTVAEIHAAMAGPVGRPRGERA